MLNPITHNKKQIIDSITEFSKDVKIVLRVSPELKPYVKDPSKISEPVIFDFSLQTNVALLHNSIELMAKSKLPYFDYKMEYLLITICITTVLKPLTTYDLCSDLCDRGIYHIPVVEWEVFKNDICILYNDPRLFIGSSFTFSNPAISHVNPNNTFFTLPEFQLRIDSKLPKYGMWQNPTKTMPVSNTEQRFNVSIHHNDVLGINSFAGREINPFMKFSTFLALSDRELIVPILPFGLNLTSKNYNFYTTEIEVRNSILVNQNLITHEFLVAKDGWLKYSLLGEIS